MNANTCTGCESPDIIELDAAGRPTLKRHEAGNANGGITSLGTAAAFFKKGACSEALMNVLDQAFDHPLPIEERGVMPLAGGIAQQGYQCGMLWGAALAAGAEAHRRLGPGPNAEAAAITASRRAVDAFRDRNRHIDCLELTDTDWTKKSQMVRYFLKGGPITCVRRSIGFAPVAFREINAALLERPVAPPCGPVSCASRMVKQAGLSDKHAVMAAGFAGGIGLCGNACGALGAAIWIIGMDCAEEGLNYEQVNARAASTIERFLRTTDYEFECSEIVGRQFDGVEDHARHVQHGGCSRVIDALADGVREALADPTATDGTGPVRASRTAA